MKKVNNRWVDDNNNSWDCDLFSKEKALQFSKTMISCIGCINCSDCSYCSDCSGCSDCINCSGCSGCSDCSGCRDKKVERENDWKIEKVNKQKVIKAIEVLIENA